MVFSETILGPGHIQGSAKMPKMPKIPKEPKISETGPARNISSDKSSNRVCLGNPRSLIDKDQHSNSHSFPKISIETFNGKSSSEKSNKSDDTLKEWAHSCKQKLAGKAKAGKMHVSSWASGILMSIKDFPATESDNKSISSLSTSTSVLESEYRKLSYNVWAYGGVAIIGMKDMLGKRLRTRKEAPPRPRRVKKYSWRIPYTPLSPTEKAPIACIAPCWEKGTFIVHSVKHIRSR